MKHKSIYGWLFATLICLIPVSIWAVHKIPILNFSSIDILVDYLARIFGIMGSSLFSLNIILSGRFKIFDKLFFGLDKMYRAHHFLGGLSLIFLLIHAELLIIGYCGQDASVAFDTKGGQGYGHSPRATEQFNTYMVGTLN